jgi:hypothetical protein
MIQQINPLLYYLQRVFNYFNCKFLLIFNYFSNSNYFSDQASQSFKDKGKIGAAVLGNKTSHKYQILLYQSNKQHISMASITSNFNYTVKNFIF